MIRRAFEEIQIWPGGSNLEEFALIQSRHPLEETWSPVRKCMSANRGGLPWFEQESQINLLPNREECKAHRDADRNLENR